MKILFILEYYPPHIGGVEKLFGELTKALSNKGHEIVVITNKFKPELKPLEKSGNLTIKRLPLKNRFLFTFLSAFFMTQDARKTDIIHTTSYNAALPAWILGKLFRKKTIITFHEVWDQLWFQLPYLNKVKKTAFYYYEKLILKLQFDTYIAVSEFTKSKLISIGIPPRKIVKIYNGVDANDFKPIQNTKPNKEKYIFTYFGRLGVSKGLDLIIHAFNEVKSNNTKLKLIIPTEPHFIYQKLYHSINTYKLDDFIEVHHELSFEDLKKEICSSDVVLIPSYSEGFCFAAVESSLLGVPIISSTKGALTETVSGKYIEMQKQDVKALTIAMNKALNGEFKCSPKKEFNLEDSINDYLELYASLLQE